MLLSAITIGTRHRKDLGDIDALAASMKSLGLLQPVVVNEADELICGERRLAAARQLGWTEIGATVAKNLNDVCRALKAERDENTCRKDFTPSEMDSLARALEPFEKNAAQERRKQHAGTAPGKRKNTSEIISGVLAGETRAKVAAAVGVSAPTLQKIRAVVDAAEEHPEAYGDVREEMDRTGKVAPAYEEVARRQVEEEAPRTRMPLAHGGNPAKLLGEIGYRMTRLTVALEQAGGMKNHAKNWNNAERTKFAKRLRKLISEMKSWVSQLEN